MGEKNNVTIAHESRTSEILDTLSENDMKEKDKEEKEKGQQSDTGHVTC
jgi:hypothetical protein